MSTNKFATQSSPSTIHWPEEFRPDRAPIHIRNELNLRASPASVWQVLIDAQRWPSFYPQASEVDLNGANTLEPDLNFSWKTMGLRISCNVREFEPETRLAWDAKGVGTWAYHAWRITPTATGCHVLTEETQHGWLCRLGQLMMPGSLHIKWHQVWLEKLELEAQCLDAGKNGH